MKPIARVSLVWVALLVGAILWTIAGRRWLSLSDTWSIYVPATLAFVTLVLTIFRTPLWNIGRGLHVLATSGTAIVLTAILLWLWFIVSWGLLGGSAP